MKRLIQFLAVATSSFLFSAEGSAAAFTFTTPTQPLPGVPGNGLTGQLWTNVDPTTDTLAQAQAIIDGGYATANFLSTTVDYPAGPDGATSTSATYASVFDATALSTLDNASVLPDDVLNTVMRFAGFFGVFGANEVWTFHIPSDDGSAVDIQGTRVLNNDGIHGFGGPSTTVEFTNPGLYALDVLFFESQASQWGIEFRGGLDGAVPTTDISSRLYSLRGFAEPGDDRLDSIQPGTPMPEPGTLALLASAGLIALGRRRPRCSGRRESCADNE